MHENLLDLGRAELHNAVCRGDATRVQQLLQNRAAVDAKDRSGLNLWSSCEEFPDKSILTQFFTEVTEVNLDNLDTT